MNTIFMNFENSKTSDPHRLLLNLTDKTNLEILTILAHPIHGKIHQRTINLKYQLQHRMKNLNYLMDHILYQMFKIILSVS